MTSSASDLVPTMSVRRSPLVTAVARGLARTALAADMPLLVGVSGGADSTALLLALFCLAGRRRAVVGPLTVVHVHHHLRGEAADLDCDLARGHAARLGLPFVQLDIYPGAEVGNVAAAARRLRYAALHRLALDRGAAVAVGHHAEDQLETMITALARGSGAAGLRGMPFERPIDPTDRCSPLLLRPMLEVRRADIRAFCADGGLIWRDDPGNDDPETLRGRLRRDVLPVLESLFPGAAGRATSAARSVASAIDALPLPAPDYSHVRDALAGDSRAADHTGARWHRSAFDTCDVTTIGAALRRAVLERRPDCVDRLGQRQLAPAAERIASDDHRPCTFRWPGGLTLEVTARTVHLDLSFPPPHEPCELCPDGESIP